MISFNYETNFELDDPAQLLKWISHTIIAEKRKEGEINYIFCSDDDLHQLNIDFLGHDTLTDIISFDYSLGKELHGDIYISIDRVKENASDFGVSFGEELCRVMIHGILHYCGYKDKTEEEKRIMRTKEEFYLARRN